VQILLARLLGVAAFGEYVYVLSWVQGLGLMALVGMDSAGVRLVAAYKSTSRWGHLRGFLQVSRLLVAVTSISAAAVGAWVVGLHSSKMPATLTQTFWIGCILLPFFVFLLLESSFLRSLKHVVAAQAPCEVLRPILMALGVSVSYSVIRTQLQAPHAMLSQTAATVLTLVLTTAILRRFVADQTVSEPAQHKTREWLSVAFPLLLLGGSHIVLSQTDVIMVGYFLSTDQAGIYSAAARLAVLVPFGLVAVNTVAAPMIAELWAEGDRETLQRLLTVAARAILATTVPLVLSLGLLGSWLLGFFGQDFRSGYPALLILISGQLINALAGSVGYLLTMTHLEKEAAAIMAATATANLLLNILLIPRFGISGAAAATAISTALWNVSMLVTVRKRLALNPLFWPRRVTRP